jgi:hypothetical protein
VWLAASTVHAVFLSGTDTSNLPDGSRRDGPNGSMWSFDREPDAAMQLFQKYRPERILVLSPASALDHARTMWSGFKNTERDATVVTPKGNVANIDLPALMILKAVLDRKLIEAGWWHDASIRIDATVGATLSIDAPPEIRTQIANWIRNVAAMPLPSADFTWAKEAAIHHMRSTLPDVQSLLWQRVSEYVLPGLDSIAPTQLQSVAKLYFQ